MLKITEQKGVSVTHNNSGVCVYDVPCVGTLRTLHMFTFSTQKQLHGQAALGGHQHCRAANCLTLGEPNCTSVALL